MINSEGYFSYHAISSILVGTYEYMHIRIFFNKTLITKIINIDNMFVFHAADNINNDY